MKTLRLMTLLVVLLPDTCISPCTTRRCESRGKGGLFSLKDWNFFLVDNGKGTMLFLTLLALSESMPGCAARPPTASAWLSRGPAWGLHVVLCLYHFLVGSRWRAVFL